MSQDVLVQVQSRAPEETKMAHLSHFLVVNKSKVGLNCAFQLFQTPLCLD